MTPTDAISVLTSLLTDAIRIRDDRANRFSEVQYEHLSPEMRLYIETQRDEAIRKVEALEVAIDALKMTGNALKHNV